jgi:hypothetical protein
MPYRYTNTVSLKQDPWYQRKCTPRGVDRADKVRVSTSMRRMRDVPNSKP